MLLFVCEFDLLPCFSSFRLGMEYNCRPIIVQLFSKIVGVLKVKDFALTRLLKTCIIATNNSLRNEKK